MPSQDGFDPARAELVFHYRNPALDEAWGEGLEVSLYRTTEGRYYRDESFTHIDADGPRITRGWVNAAKAVEILADCDGGARIAELFPDSWQGRTWRRYATCNLTELGTRTETILRDAQPVHPATGASADEALYRAATGFFVMTRRVEGRVEPEALDPSRALRWLLGRDCAVATIEQHFPDSAAALLARAAGARSWHEMNEVHFPRLLDRARCVHTSAAPDPLEGWIETEALYHLEGDLFLARITRKGRATAEFDVLNRVEALLRLCGMADVPDATKSQWFPDRATWRAAQESVGLSFPEPA